MNRECRIGRRKLVISMVGMMSGVEVLANETARPLRMVIPFPPGGTSDTVGRLIANTLSDRTKRPVVVENRAGAGTVVGADNVAKGPPDGSALLLTSPGVAINAVTRGASLPYHTENDLDPIITLAELPMAIYASKESGIRTLTELVAAANAKPGGLTCGSAGEGSTGHFTMKMLEQVAGIQLNHVPFQGSAPSLNALLGGHIALAIDTAYLGAPHVSSGKIAGVASLGKTRTKLLPAVPTALESNVALESVAWFGISVRRGTPATRVDQLNAELRAVMQDARVSETLARDGFQIVADLPDEARARFAAEIKKLRAVGTTNT